MQRALLFFCALILLSPTLRATPAEDFTARGKELLTNKEKLSETDRLRRLFDFRGRSTRVLKNGALPMSVLEAHLKEWVAKRKSA